MSSTDSARPRRRWPRIVLRGSALTLLLALVLVALAPWLLSFEPVQQLALRAALPGMRGRISLGDAHFGWWTPLRVDDLLVRDPEAQPLVEVGSIGTDRTLWQLLTHPRDWGDIRIDTPEINIIATETTNNFAATFPKLHDQLHRPTPGEHAGWKDRRMHVAIHDATVQWRVSNSSRSWSVDRVPFSFGIEPADPPKTQSASIVIDHALVFDRREASPGLCNDLLKYAAPVLANVTTAQGKVSLEFDGGRLPADDLRAGDLAGRLTLHTVEIGPGALVRTVANFLHLPEHVTLAHDSVVEFKMTGGRVHHEGLEFGIETVRVRTSGSVGFDQTLDLLAEVRLQLSDTLIANRPILKALDQNVLRFPIKGTLSKPAIDAAGIGRTALDLLAAAVRNAREGRDAPDPPTEEQIQQLRDAGVLVPNDTSPETVAPPKSTGQQAAEIAVDVIQ
ncbi:MAG TPA: hypothetical protein VG713_22675, partial [Pirellulales bacterium]|nr:hypothetical protein [Pirellulales bacterium]